jgi:hypothetical protein
VANAKRGIMRERIIVGKGNLRVLIADSYIFYGVFKRQGLTVVCIPQLIADLLEEGGVCTEAAEKLLEKMEQPY